MAPAVTRELSITYGGFVVGGATDRLLDGKYRINSDYDGGSIEFDFIITGATEAAFATEVAAVEAAFRKPFLALSVDLGAKNLRSWSHTGNTGFNAAPEIIKAGDPADTGRSRQYSVRIDVDLPADQTTGLKNQTVTVDFSPSRRRSVTFEGQYTALGANSSSEQFDASFITLSTAILLIIDNADPPDAIGWEITSQEATTDQEDKVTDFTVVFSEVLFPDTDDVDLINLTVSITQTKNAPGDTPGKSGAVTRLVDITAEVSASVDKERTTDLKGKYESVIRPLALDYIRSTLGLSALAMISESPTFDPTENTINVTLTIQALGGGGLLEHKVDIETRDISGVVLVPFWGAGAYGKYVFQGPARAIRRVVRSSRRPKGGIDLFPNINAGVSGAGVVPGQQLAKKGQAVPAGGSPFAFGAAGITTIDDSPNPKGQALPAAPAAGGAAAGGLAAAVAPSTIPTRSIWILMQSRETTTDITLGSGAETIPVVDTVVEEEWERADIPNLPQLTATPGGSV